jgi:hypothetical protein
VIIFLPFVYEEEEEEEHEREEERIVVPDIIIISVSLSNSYPPRVKVVSSSRGQKEEVL